MDEKIKSRMSFINYKVKTVILKENEKYINDGKPLPVKMDLSHKTNINKGNMKIDITVKIFNEAEKNNFPFYMEVIVEGFFSVEGDEVERFEVNGISLLYPYIRSIVSTYTANSNLPTLILPPINVMHYYKMSKENEEKN